MFIFFITIFWLNNSNIEILNIKISNIIFLFLVCITKRAQLPFRGWLPKAMRAPTPTSALVHSSTLVTAGLCLIIKFRSNLNISFLLNFIFIIGTFTILVGNLNSINE
jgi:NADH:ubiquinone oxidoreductase subunit 5 (subunit L)/multisubunit Na+/H+ antiporter MnhA subunit